MFSGGLGLKTRGCCQTSGLLELIQENVHLCYGSVCFPLWSNTFASYFGLRSGGAIRSNFQLRMSKVGALGAVQGFGQSYGSLSRSALGLSLQGFVFSLRLGPMKVGVVTCPPQTGVASEGRIFCFSVDWHP